MTSSPLVSVEWLSNHLRDRNVRVVDVRWYLFDPSKTGHGEYERGHIPGAVFMDIDADLAAPPGEGPGRHPLPAPDAFASAAIRAGIQPGMQVVAYDDSGGTTAARLWWLLRYFGHSDASVLDGGIHEWVKQGHPLETGEVTATPGAFTPVAHPELVADKRAVQELARDPESLVIDTRKPERYEGRSEPIDPRAGHIPGARSAPYTQALRGDADPRLKPVPALREHFVRLGADKAAHVAVYCGSGVNACLNILALELAGFSDALLYEGSWSDWSRDPELPAATGPESPGSI